MDHSTRGRVSQTATQGLKQGKKRMNSDQPLDETGTLPSAERDLSKEHEIPEVAFEIFLVQTYGKGTPGAAEMGGGAVRKREEP